MEIDAGVLLKTWMDKARTLLYSPRAIRWGGFALVAGGLLGVASEILNAFAEIKDPYGSSVSGSIDRLFAVENILMLAEMMFVTLGLAGLYALVATIRHEKIKSLAVVGFVLAVLPLAGISVLVIYMYLFPLEYSYSSGRFSLFDVFAFGWTWVRPAGILLLGIVALWSRGLGRWRVLPLVIGLASLPFLQNLISAMLYPDLAPPPRDMWVTASLLSEVPLLLPDLGWILLGALLPGAKRRELSILAREKRMLEEKTSPSRAASTKKPGEEATWRSWTIWSPQTFSTTTTTAPVFGASRRASPASAKRSPTSCLRWKNRVPRETLSPPAARWAARMKEASSGTRRRGIGPFSRASSPTVSLTESLSSTGASRT